MRRFIFISLLLSAILTPVIAQDVVGNTITPNDTVTAPGAAVVVDNAPVVNDTLVVPQDSVAHDRIIVTDSTIFIPDTLWRLYAIEPVEDNGLPHYGTSLLFMPLVFEKYENIPYEGLTVADVHYFPQPYKIDKTVVLSSGNTWLWRENRLAGRMRSARNYLIVNRPDLVKYNYENLPKAPKEYVIINDPTKQTITIVEKPREILTSALESKPVKIKR